MPRTRTLSASLTLAFISCLAACLTSTKSIAQQPVFDSPTEAQSDADFSIQGEYTSGTRAMQVVALGNAEFDVVLFTGGLPGAGWDGSPPRRLNIEASEVEDLIDANDFTRVERKSPTLGLLPPENAVVLFDGTQASIDDHWMPGAKMTDDGLLMQGCTSQDKFVDYSLHLEFRTPYMPEARGQGRGNSGLYHQGRYETQILDSFGLEGKMNETGGLYSIKDPDLNMCLPPLTWQTYDVDFAAARFDSDGKKVSDPRITVRLNGVLVQQDVALPHTTTAAPVKEGTTPGPIYLQDHGNPVRFRNIWVVPRDLEQEGKRPRIAGFERFFAQGEPSGLGGRVLLSELGCVACHASSEAAIKQAPVLDQVGERIRPDYLVEFISAPHHTKPGTTMPDLLAGMNAAERQSTANAIASFLLTTGSTIDRSGDPRALRRGEDLFHSIGCTACHSPQNDARVNENTSVPLTGLGTKYTLDSLANFLKNPHAIRPSGRMPSFGFTPEQSSDLATYLLRDVVVGQGAMNMQAAFYEGSWDTMPDLAPLKPYLETETYDLDILAGGRTENFAVRFDSSIVIPKKAKYRFRLGSDDGSRLFIDEKMVIDNDGVHPMSLKTADIELTKGVHSLRVEYFEKGGEEVLQLDIRGGGLAWTSVGAIATLDPGAKATQPLIESRFEGDATLVAKGRELFSSVGCAACHQLKMDGTKLANTTTAKALADLNFSKGCLSDEVAPGQPNYDLSNSQKLAIRAAANEIVSGKQLDDPSHVQLTMATMNCYACHQRDGLGGPELSRNDVFQTTMKEMGDEGRVPPPLTGVGDKLKQKYLEDILNQGAAERPYMLAQMPGFGTHNLQGLVDRFVRLDQQSTAEIIAPHEPLEKIKSDGRLLVGEKGLSCVKCHVFGGKGAPGIGAIDLQQMTTRLREDWFHRYLMSPTTYRPGTRMPASFPDGKSVLPELYQGQPSTQIAAMWEYLSDGASAREPIGVQQQLIELVPNQRPTIYRNFIEGLTPRAIAVGYPEQGNLAWDANRLCLSLLWKGAFIDASKHWVGRGPGNQGPLGDEPISFENTAPIARLDAADDRWPVGTARELGHKFTGYRLNDKGQPTFRYRVDGAMITDTPIPVSGDGRLQGFDRKLEVTGELGEGLYLRLASGKKIEALDDGWYRVDDRVSVRVDARPTRIQVDGNIELRLPLTAGRNAITQQIRW